MPVRADHRRLQVVADDEPRHAAQRGEQVHMRPEPVRQPLAGARLRENEVRGAHRRHKQPRLPDRPGGGVGDADRVAREVDEHLLAGDVALPHRRRQTAFPLVIGLAEPRVAEAVRMPRPVFLPQERPRHAAPAQLPLHLDPVRHRPAALATGPRARKQQALQRRVAQLGRQWPRQPRGTRARQVGADRSLADAQRRRNGSVAQPGLILQPQNVADQAHRQSLGRHPAGLVQDEAAIARSDCRQSSLRHLTQVPAIPWNRCPPPRITWNPHRIARAIPGVTEVKDRITVVG